MCVCSFSLFSNYNLYITSLFVDLFWSFNSFYSIEYLLFNYSKRIPHDMLLLFLLFIVIILCIPSIVAVVFATRMLSIVVYYN